MMYAYNESYLNSAMKNLGEAFDYATNICNLGLDEFLKLFISTGVADDFGKGVPKFICGLSGTELVMYIFMKAGLSKVFPEPQTEYECSPEYWCGWALAYYQWKTCNSFKSIYESISIDEVLKLYPIMHEASEDRFVDTLNAIIKKNDSISRLQKQRRICGYSQRELAEEASVNIRTLQQYELKTKDINKASVQSVLALASALGCQIDDLLEVKL